LQQTGPHSLFSGTTSSPWICREVPLADTGGLAPAAQRGEAQPCIDSLPTTAAEGGRGQRPLPGPGGHPDGEVAHLHQAPTRLGPIGGHWQPLAPSVPDLHQEGPHGMTGPTGEGQGSDPAGYEQLLMSKLSGQRDRLRSGQWNFNCICLGIFLIFHCIGCQKIYKYVQATRRIS
jgi:hypothetical protein